MRLMSESVSNQILWHGKRSSATISKIGVIFGCGLCAVNMRGVGKVAGTRKKDRECRGLVSPG
jgi:hypothetical protein